MAISKGRLLIVHCDEEILEPLVEAMQDYGFETVSALSGRDAFSHYCQSHFDALVTAMMMPEVSGFDLVYKVRAMTPDQPVLVLSAYDEKLLHQFESLYPRLLRTLILPCPLRLIGETLEELIFQAKEKMR